MISVKNYMRVCPPLIVMESEIDDIMGRLGQAISRADENHTPDIDYSSSGSLAANEADRRDA